MLKKIWDFICKTVKKITTETHYLTVVTIMDDKDKTIIVADKKGNLGILEDDGESFRDEVCVGQEFQALRTSPVRFSPLNYDENGRKVATLEAQGKDCWLVTVINGGETVFANLYGLPDDVNKRVGTRVTASFGAIGDFVERYRSLQE